MNAKSLLHCLVVVTTALAVTATPSLEPGFLFEYAQSGPSSLHLPVTRQCEKIQLRWKRDDNSTGTPPVAPYFLQVYNSASSSPYVVPAGLGPSLDWEVPFAPSTQYQICMFDTNGVSGGCEQIHTMIESSAASTPSCQNVTEQTPMSVTATVPTGALPMYGYIDQAGSIRHWEYRGLIDHPQCKKLSLRANQASGPFTLTIAPSGHAPYNITSNSADLSWPVSLSEGTRFFVSLHSSDGQSWANGPIRVGGQGPDACLSYGSIRRRDFNVYIICSTIGSTCFGLLAGLAAYYLFLRLRRPRRRAPSQKYYSHPYLSRDDPSKSIRTGTPAASVIAASTIGQAIPDVYTPSSVSDTSGLTTPRSRSSELPLLASSLEPLRPLRPNSGQLSHTSRHSTRSRLHQSVTPYTVGPSETGSSSHSSYPPDIKRPLPPDDTESTTTRDDSMSLASTSHLQRALSARSRAPTYVADPPPNSIPPPTPSATRGIRSSHRPQAAGSADEYPPQYGNHVADHTLNYDPNILSSGTRL